MIQQIDAILREWAAGACHCPVDVSLELPPEANQDTAKPVVGLYLFALAGSADAASDRPKGWAIVARYLVTVWAKQPELQHQLIGDLLAAALREHTLEVAWTPSTPDMWLSFGLPPRPSFVLERPVFIERLVDAPQHLVRSPPIVRTGSGVPASGQVIGSRGTAIAGAKVTHLDTGRSAVTDRQGHFHLGLSRGTAAPQKLEVSAGGRSKTFPIRIQDSPFILRFTQVED